MVDAEIVDNMKSGTMCYFRTKKGFTLIGSKISGKQIKRKEEDYISSVCNTVIQHNASHLQK